MQLRGGRRGIHRSRVDSGRARADLQRRWLRRMSPRPDSRRRQPDHGRRAGRFLERRVHRTMRAGPCSTIARPRSDSRRSRTRITNVVAFRASLSIFGLGFVEALSNTTLQDIANAQPSSQRGQIISVPVLEAPGTEPNRSLRLQGSTGEPGFVLGGCLCERDGNHQPAATDREHVERQDGTQADGRAPGN